MIVALCIFLLGLTPSILSIWVMRHANDRAQERLRLAMESVATRGLPTFSLQPDQHYVEGMGFIIGDFTCQFNARSHLLRCAINPSGPCEGCLHYQPKALGE
jgi:hypothetical protein